MEEDGKRNARRSQLKHWLVLKFFTTSLERNPTMAALISAIPEEARRRAQQLLSRWGVPPEFMTELIEHKASATFPKGESIFQQGSTANVGYWVLTGLVKVHVPLMDGTRVAVKVAGPGDFVGVIDCLRTSARRVQALEAKAMTKVSVAIFTRDHVLAMLKTMSPGTLVALLEGINTTWSELFSWCARFLGLSLHDRLQSIFQSLASRYGVRDSRGILLTIELCHEDLAEMIATSRPMVSRLIAEFIERGELARQGKHYILAPPSSAGEYSH
jgi:CRP/FNR family transcriptional regulator, cyclic AMP receptor protein